MKLNYTLKTEDQMVFYKKIFKENSFLFNKYIFGILFLIALAIANFYQTSKGTTDNNPALDLYGLNFWLDVLGYYIFLVCFVLLLRYINVNAIKTRINNSEFFIGDRELEIVDDKLILTSKYSKTEYQFSAFKRIEKVKDYYFIILEKQVSIIVPRITPGSDELIKQLSERIK